MKIVGFFLSMIVAHQCYCSTKFQDPNFLVQHVAKSIDKAEAFKSNIDPRALQIVGYSSPKVRHLLNNLFTIPGINYLEIGTWQGSTFVSALCRNERNVVKAYAVDNWSQFDGPRDEFVDNTKRILKGFKFKLIEDDCFAMDLKQIDSKINVYFYDGDHRFIDQEMAFTYFDSVFDDTFIAIVDDYNYDWVQEATQKAFKSLNYTVHYERYLPSPKNGGPESWWNGLYVAVVSKPKK